MEKYIIYMRYSRGPWAVCVKDIERERALKFLERIADHYRNGGHRVVSYRAKGTLRRLTIHAEGKPYKMHSWKVVAQSA